MMLSVCVPEATLTGGVERDKEPLLLLGVAAEGVEPQAVSTAPMAYVDGALPLIGHGQLVLPPTECAWACVQISMVESDQKTRDAGKAAGGIVSTVGPILTNLNPIGALALPMAQMFAGLVANNEDDVMLSVIWSGFRDDNFGVPDGQDSMVYLVENKRATLTIRVGLHQSDGEQN